MTDYQSINEQVQTLFQQSNQPNMYLPDFQFYHTLQTIKPMSLPRHQSIKRMINLINIVLYLKTNKLRPCQLKFHHVGCDKENNWGLKHVICYRVINCPKQKDTYENAEFLYHSNQDTELVWNLGKVWLRFYSDRKVTVIDKSQAEIDEVIDNSVTDEKINKILKKSLKIKSQNRVTFQKFIQDEVFSTQNFQQNLFSSISQHFQSVSQNEKVLNGMNQKKEIHTTYEEEVFRRQLQESLDVCGLLEKCIKNIRDMHEKSVEIEFHVFIIKVEAYCILKRLDEKKISQQIVDYTPQQKKIYSKFVTKMLTLKDQLQRKMRMQIFTSDGSLNPNQRQFLIPTNEMDLTKIHPAFKNIIINYYLESVQEIKRLTEKNLPESVKRDKMCGLEKFALVFLLTRLSVSIFSELRSYIFEEVIKRSNQPLKVFTLKDLLNFIDTANDFSPIRKIRQRVFVNGFQNGSSNTQIYVKKS